MNNSIQDTAIDFIANKNNATLTSLINRLKPGLISYMRKFTKDSNMINDAIQNTFISIWEKLEQYKVEYNFSTWAYAIARNEILYMIREQRKTVSMGNILFADHDSDESYCTNYYAILDKSHKDSASFHSSEYEFNNDIGKQNIFEPSKEEVIYKLYDASISAIKKLKEPIRTVMIEREINKLPLSTIANKLGWNTNTVKTRVLKGRKEVKKILQEKYSELAESYVEFER